MIGTPVPESDRVSRGTGQKCIRLPDDVWARFGEVAKAKGTTRTELIREWIRVYIDASGVADSGRP